MLCEVCFAQPWRKVIQTFFGTSASPVLLQIHTFFMNLLLQRLVAFVEDILGPALLRPDIAHKTKKKTNKKTLFKTAPDRITAALSNESFYWLAAVVYSLNGLAVSQLRENVMGINLIGLLSGVIAVCGPREHPGNDAHTHTHTHPSALQSPSTSGSMGNYWDSADSGRTKHWKHTDNALYAHTHTCTRLTWTQTGTRTSLDFWKADRMCNKVNGRTVQRRHLRFYFGGH